MRDYAHPFISAIFRFFVSSIAYSKGALTDFQAKYAERRGSAQGCASWGSRNQF